MYISDNQKIEAAFDKLLETIEAVGKRQSKEYTQIFGYVPRDLAQKFREKCTRKRLQHSEVIESLVKAWVADEDKDE